MSNVTHVGYCDESHWNQGQYRTIGLVTAETKIAADLEISVEQILFRKGAKEFSWKDLRTADKFSLAKELCYLAVEKLDNRQMRIDVLIWDTRDRRHTVRNRDDTENLARMYYHLLANVTEKRWPGGSIWEICPDERTDMNWQTLEDCLRHPSRKTRTSGQFRIDPKVATRSSVISVNQVTSSARPLVQVADLFAGLAAFSWNSRSAYEQWLLQESGQAKLNLFGDNEPTILSPGETYKARALQCLDDINRNMRLGIRYSPNDGLRSSAPIKPLNFWFYRPQSPEDKAPQKYRK